MSKLTEIESSNMTTNETKYKQKAKSSFKTKLDIYLFWKTLNNELTTISIEDFKDFKITDKLVGSYSNEYWQFEKDHKIQGIEIQNIEKSIHIWKQSNKEMIKTLITHYVEFSFPEVFPMKLFTELLENSFCSYCNISSKDILILADKIMLNKKNLRGWNMEIDRLNSNKEYSKENCCMSCYWCNNAKTDEFTPTEFALIGITISKIWETRKNSDQ